jgi:hypothetical protein
MQLIQLIVMILVIFPSIWPGALRKRLLTWGSRVSPGSNLKQGILAPLCEGLKVQPSNQWFAAWTRSNQGCFTRKWFRKWFPSLVWSHSTQYTHLTLW